MAAEWRARGCEVMVAAASVVTPSLQAELGAKPHFRVHTYWTGDGDPFCGWLTAFFHSAGRMQEDVQSLGPFTPDDLLYVNSIQPAQLMALASFVQTVPGNARPRIVAELGTAPGLDFEWCNDVLQFHAKDPRHDAKGVLYRFAATHLAGAASCDPMLVTFHPTCSAIYAHLLGRRVHTLPVPHQACGRASPPPARDKVTVGVLGHQRADKGYQLVPDIAALLLKARPDLHILIHNGAPGYMQEVQAVVRALAAEETRITVDERVADFDLWDALLLSCDVILCPYHPPSYTGAYSAIVGEAIARGLPLVVPAASTLARTVAEFGSPGAVFSGFEAEPIAAATLQVLTQLPAFLSRAHAASRRWQQEMGVARTVDGILALLGMGEGNAMAKPERRAA